MVPQFDPEFWTEFLNDRAAELGLEKNVKMVKPREGEIIALSWVYEMPDGMLVELGWNIESAELALRGMAP